MADDLDRASEYAAMGVAGRISEIRAAARAEGEGEIYCEDCGEEIPEARRRAAPGCSRCISCQQDFERMKG